MRFLNLFSICSNLFVLDKNIEWQASNIVSIDTGIRLSRFYHRVSWYVLAAWRVDKSNLER